MISPYDKCYSASNIGITTRPADIIPPAALTFELAHPFNESKEPGQRRSSGYCHSQSPGGGPLGAPTSSFYDFVSALTRVMCNSDLYFCGDRHPLCI